MKNLFAGRHFDREVILLCVRCYLRYKLSLRDLVEMDKQMAREMSISHSALRHGDLYHGRPIGRPNCPDNH